MELRWQIPHLLWWMLCLARVVTAGIACLHNPCSHGICIDDLNSTFSCYCIDGYTGVTCQTNWDECWSDPCQNGGTCVDGIASYNCTCPEGFIGDNCEINYDECESNPCLNNGTCIDMTNGYVCSCIPGYSGEHCEIDIAVCNLTEEVRCHNGGQCIEGPGFKFYCKCSPGWTGKQCEDQIDECKSDPCQNGGLCIDLHADYMCACTYGFTGKSCEVQIEFCEKNSCQNNAICVIEDGLRVCYCVPDFHGERCELQYDECLLGPGCMNGGSCIDGIDNFTCSCPPRLTGPLCECLILEDGTYDCKYVSPTPLPGFTQSVFITTIHEDITTTEMITTAYPSDFNDTIPRIPTVVVDAETNASTAKVNEVTSVEYSTDTSIASSAAETETVGLETSTILTEITTVKVNITEITSTETTDSSDSKVESTTGCQESCQNATDATARISPEGKEDATTAIVYTEITVPVSTSSYPIADFTVKPYPAETTMRIITETTTKSDEVTYSPKLDSTTEKLFTDAPTELRAIDMTTPYNIYATDEDLTTMFETSTYSTSTIETQCTDSICHDHGTCINTPHGIRCHCKFNYGGKFCEEKVLITSAAFGENSFIVHKIENSSSINVIFNAKTLLSDGQIMHVDIARGVYMQLYIHSGQLMFKFSCGYQTMLLSELNMFVNKGYPMKIESRLDLFLKEQHCNATLLLNDTAAMSGDQIAHITSLEYKPTLYLGNWNNTKDPKNTPFIGCIRDLVVNGEKREIFSDAVNGEHVTECSSLSCLSNPCHNGGSCSDLGESYTCSCTNGWMGDHCNQSVCEHNPCQFGGSCVKYPGSGFLCLCPYGKHGIFCEYNVEITRPSLAPISSGLSSFLVYPLSPSAINSDRFDLRMRFQTTDVDQIALLAYVGQNGRHDSRSQHLALTFVKGYVMLTWNMGNGARRIFTSRVLTPRRGGHTVRVWRRGRTAGFNVDGRYNVSGNAPANDYKMSLLPYIYIGGHPSEDFQDLPHDLPLHTGWRGCVWEVGGQAVSGGKAVGGRGVGQCGVAQCTVKSCNAPRGVCIHSPATYGCICNEGWFGATCSVGKSPCDRSVSLCRGRCVMTAGPTADCDCPYGIFGINCEQVLIPTDVYFTGTRSYAQLHERPISSVSISFEAEIKPTKERGLVLFVNTPHFYTALSLQGGLLEYRWSDRLSGMTSIVRSAVVISMSQWHSVKAGRYGSRLYVWVDGSLSTEAMLAHAYPHTSTNATITVGGAKDLAKLPFEAMSGPPESYTGCLRNLHINNIVLPLEQQNILEGQNLGDCDGTPCGSEACGGGSCVVENGQAKCACTGTRSSIYSGSRCRRQTECSSDTCVPPGGICRNGACVCSAGYAGNDCEQKINVTIAQFNGDSLLSLVRKNKLGGRIGEQRLGDNVKPTHITFNFTTAEPSGLLVWIETDLHYIGLGLESGYIKVSWSLREDTDLEVFSAKSTKGKTSESRTLTRLVPQAGYLADAEWHAVMLRLEEKNITVSVDELLAYFEETGWNWSDYVNVAIFLGGVTPEKSSNVKKLFPLNFKGCIGDIKTQEGFPIANYTDVVSENINSCQLFP